MESIKTLTAIDYSSLIIASFSVLIGIKAIVSLFEWFFDKLGIETKWMRKKREEHDLLMKTSKGLIELQKKHEEDIKRSDLHDEEIRQDIKNLTDMFIQKEIFDMRWEINNFANKIADGKRCNKDSYQHCIKTHERYERILRDNKLENGEVEISMELINESYKEKLKNGF